jgi:hypothetical protein
MSEGHNEIVPIGDPKSTGLQKVVDTVRSLGKRKEFDSKTARDILQLVVDTNENSLTISDLNKLGPYSVKDIQRAVKVVSLDVFRKNGGEPTMDNFIITKKTKAGESLHFAIYSTHRNINSVSLQLGGGENTRKYFIVAHIPTQEPKKNSVEQFYAGVFNDLRPNHESYTQPYGELHMAEYRKSWLGFRWLAENLLRWEDGFKLPEELRTKLPQLNPAQLQKVLPNST